MSKNYVRKERGNTMLKIESLEKKYVVGKKDVPVLKDVSVEINEGDFV